MKTKQQKILKNLIKRNSTTKSKMYCSILVPCLQSGGIEKKKKEKCSKMTKILKEKGKKTKI